MESTVGENSPACTSNLSTKITHGPLSVHQAYNIIKVVKGVSVVNKTLHRLLIPLGQLD